MTCILFLKVPPDLYIQKYLQLSIDYSIYNIYKIVLSNPIFGTLI